MEEKIKILELLKEGKITVEDSIKLMESIKETNEEAPKPRILSFEGFPDKISELIGDITENVSKAVNDVAVSIDLGEFNNREYVDSKQFIFTTSTPETLEKLKLRAKNSGIKIEGYHGSVIEIRGNYRPKLGKTAEITLRDDHGEIELEYDYNAVKHLSIQAKIPNIFINMIDAFTTNSVITIDDLKAKDIYAKTSNSSIKVEDVEAGMVDLETSNSSISVEDSKIDKIKLTTSNSSIKLEDVFMTETRARTSNGKIQAETVTPIDEEAVLDALTSNGSITVDTDGISSKFRASTSYGKVTCDGNFDYIENSKSFVEAVSPDYNEAARKLKMNLSTSNGNIRIK